MVKIEVQQLSISIDVKWEIQQSRILTSKLYLTHGLVFMLAGIGHKWKQVVAYYYTDNKVNGSSFKESIVEIIQRAEAIGLRVNGVVLDMGSADRAMWKAFGINAGRYTVPHNSCVHPFDGNRKLFFFHDAPRALKNLKEGLLNNNYMTIPETFVKSYNLISDKVSAKQFDELISKQKHLQFLLTPKLRKEYLEKDRHFLEMRVASASSVFNYDVSSALQSIADEDETPELRTASWIVGFIARWFTLMTSRRPNLALGKLKSDKYTETIKFLNEVVDLMTLLKIGEKEDWKPFQTGIVISTLSSLQLSLYLIEERSFQFVLLGRFTQDCIENLFSVLRSKHCTLNALQFKYHLEMITVSQCMRPVFYSNYDEDDREYLPDFLTVLQDRNRIVSSEQGYLTAEVDISNLMTKTIIFGKLELYSLYNIAGYIIASIQKSQVTCEQCIVETGSRTAKPLNYSKLMIIRSHAENTLFFVNERTFNFFVEMEKIFRSYHETLRGQRNVNLKKFFIKRCSDIPYVLPQCHDLKAKIIQRYIVFRLKISSKTYHADKSSTLTSKSMAMHPNVK